MNPLMEQMRTQLMAQQIPLPPPKGLVPRGPVSIEDAVRHLYVSPEDNFFANEPRPDLSPYDYPLEKNKWPTR